MTLLTGNLPLPESQLRDFSKALPRSLSTSQEQELSKDYPFLLDKLIETAYNPFIAIGHRGVAVNVLCSLMGRSASLDLEEPLSPDRWFRTFDIVLDRSGSVKSKPLRQLLACLFNILPSFKDTEQLQITERVVETVLQILLQQSDHTKAKPALHVLTHMLTKDVITIGTLIQYSTSITDCYGGAECTASSNITKLQWLLRMLFDWVQIQDTSIAAGQTACALVKKLLSKIKYQNESRAPIWGVPLTEVLRDNIEELSNYRSHLLPNLFKLHLADYITFLSVLGLEDIFTARSDTGQRDANDEVDVRLLFVCLEIGKETGIVIESDAIATEMVVRDGVISIPDAMLAQVVENATDSVRLSGLALLISSSSVTRPFTPRALRCLHLNLTHLFMETDVHMRGEVLVCIQRLVDRIKAAMGLLRRVAGKIANGNVHQKSGSQHETTIALPGSVLEEHRKFLRSFLSFVKSQLHPAAAYQRHVTGLRSLIIVAKSGLDERVAQFRLSKQAQVKEAARWPFHEPIFEPALTRTLQDLLMDPFEDVRSFAASLLVMQADIAGASSGAIYSKFMERAERIMLSSGRADHADGVSRANAIVFEAADHLASSNDLKLSKESQMESLVSKLENGVLLAKNNIPLAVGKFPLHGVLASLRLVLDGPDFYAHIKDEMFATWLDFHTRLVMALQDVWCSVKGVLCNDAPEGFIPDDMEEEISIGTKDILSYCWRALKESSSLLRVLVLKVPMDTVDRPLVSPSHFRTLCNLAFCELVELRHRGAFSAVAQAFAACCFRANALHHDDLLHSLYGDTLRAIKSKGSATTRRSAGLPSLIVGILTACPDSPLFKQGIEDLLREAKVATEELTMHGDPLPQVHALNCLRSIFINTILGPYTEPHIAACLNLAGNCLTSNIWAIRNCGLMLFRALIDRMLGSTDSQGRPEDDREPANPRFSYGDFPKLLDMVLKLLTPDSTRFRSTQSALESVFPALKLIQRMLPPFERRFEVRELVLRLCQSPHWHVRDMAARTYASLIPNIQRRSSAINLIPGSTSEENVAHGQLLCISYLVRLELRSADMKPSAIDELETHLSGASGHLKSTNKCPFTKALYVDILNVLGLARLKAGAMDFSEMPAISRGDIAQVFEETPAVRKSFALQVLLKYLFQMTKEGEVSNNESAVDGPDLLGYLQLLEATDSQTCLQALEPIIDIAASIPSSGIDMIADHLSFSATYDDERDTQSIGSARILLFKLYEALGRDECVIHDTLRPGDMRQTLCHARRLPPSLVENTVLLWGPIVNAAGTREPIDEKLLEELKVLAVSLRSLIGEFQPFDLRIAVARCLANMPKLWNLQITYEKAAQLDSVRLKFILLVYDLLNDDDDEIRNIATMIASLILSDGLEASLRLKHTVPLLASQRLILHFLAQYPHLPELFDQAIVRTTGVDRQASAKAAFGAAAAENNALFMVEKQNLFVDPVREAILWSQFLKRIPDLKRIRRDLIRSFVAWTKGVLSLLRERMQHGVDGVLGWTSKPDMFVFGMRVWCAVDVILTWQRRFGKQSRAMSSMMAELGRVLALGREQEVHPLWLKKIEKVLIKELRERMQDNAARRNFALVRVRIGSAIG